MNLLFYIKKIVKEQIYSSVPKHELKDFKKSTFYDNVSRFSSQSFLLIFVDLLSLAAYMHLYFIRREFNMIHIAAHIIKITVMSVALIYLTYRWKSLYRSDHFLDKNLDMLYPILHIILEFGLFLTGPKDFGAVIRLLGGTFIASVIPIINQFRVFILQTALFSAYIIILFRYMNYDNDIQLYHMIMNHFIIIFACTNFSANLVYSSAVINFLSSKKEFAVRKSLHEVNIQLDRINNTDILTGISNRRNFNFFMDKTWQFAYEKGRNVSIMMLDIDYFRRYNNRFGHVAGDECLIKITQSIRNELDNKEFMFARFGGEEFIIAVYDKNHKEMVELAQSLRQNIERLEIPNPDSDVSRFITVCIGLVTKQANEFTNYSQIISWVDECLYKAKRSGKNRVIHTDSYPPISTESEKKPYIELERIAYAQSMVNSITQLPNRMKFYEDIKQWFSDSSEKGFIIIIDINNFKRINGMFNHTIGDHVLLEVSGRLKQLCGHLGELYHYAIDQYILIINSSRDKTRQIMIEIQQYFAETKLDVNGTYISINFTMAAVEFNQRENNIDDLMINLDITLQKVKRERDVDFAFFQEKDKLDYVKKMTLERQIRESVEQNFKGFVLFYQPLVSAKSGKCLGAEALIRWRSPEGKVISPIHIIPILESSGLMEKVEPWIFEEAASTCSSWMKGGASKDFFIQVNLSAVHLSRDTLEAEVTGALERNGLMKKNILLEVTESSVMKEMKKSLDNLENLRALGIKIVIDDFGTGYSSLSYLSALPVDEIKIDRSFVKHIETNLSARNFLQSIIDMSKSLGKLVCVEGIETDLQREILSHSNVDFLQGFLVSKPIEGHEFYKKFILSN